MKYQEVALSEVASINPRPPKIDDEDVISFVGMAQLDAVTAATDSGVDRTFGEVKSGYRIFQDKDLLLAKITPCFENNKIGQAALRHPIGVGSTEFHVIRPREMLDARYILHYLRRDEVRVKGERRMTGSGGQRRVPTNYVENLRVPLPLLDEQRRIAAILDKADSLRAKRREASALAAGLLQAAFSDMFGNLRADARLADCAAIQGGLQITSRRSGLPIEVPYLRVANVFRGRLDLEEVKTMRVTAAEADRTRLREGDLLFVEGHGNADEVGRVAAWDGSILACVHQNHLIRARLETDRLLPLVAETWCNSPRGRSHFRQAGNTTSGLNTISAEVVLSAPVPIPPMSSQRQFEKRANFIANLDVS